MEKDIDGCKGYWIHTIDGSDFDCKYKYASYYSGCEDCIFGAHPTIDSFDPRVKPEDYFNG